MVCHGKPLRAEAVDKVFNADGRYVLVTRMPLTVCKDCDERSFNREATEWVQMLVHDPPYDGTDFAVPMNVYEFS